MTDLGRSAYDRFSIMELMTSTLELVHNENDVQELAAHFVQLMGRLDDADVKQLSLVLCRGHKIISDLSKDLKVQIYAAMEYPRFYQLARSVISYKLVETVTHSKGLISPDTAASMRKFAHFLGILGYYCNTPTLTEELDWLALLELAETNGVFNYVMPCVLHFLKIFDSFKGIFTIHCAWLSRLVTQISLLVFQSNCAVSGEIRSELRHLAMRLRVPALDTHWQKCFPENQQQVQKSTSFVKNDDPKTVQDAINRIMQNVGNLVVQLRENFGIIYESSASFQHVQWSKLYLLMYGERIIENHISNYVKLELANRHSFLQRLIINEDSQSLTVACIQIRDKSIEKTREYMTSVHFMKACTDELQKLIQILLMPSASYDIVSASSYQHVDAFVSDISGTLTSIVVQMCNERATLEIVRHVDNICMALSKFEFRKVFVFHDIGYMTSTNGSVLHQRTSDKALCWSRSTVNQIHVTGTKNADTAKVIYCTDTFNDNLVRFFSNAKRALSIHEYVERDAPVLKAIMKVLESVKQFCEFPRTHSWKGVVSGMVVEYLFNYHLVDKSCPALAVGLQRTFRRIVHTLLELTRLHFSTNDVTNFIIDAVIENLGEIDSICITAFKDLLLSVNLNADAVDRALRTAVKRDFEKLNTGPAPLATEEFVRRFADADLPLYLPATTAVFTAMKLVPFVVVVPLQGMNQRYCEIFEAANNFLMGVDSGSTITCLITRILLEDYPSLSFATKAYRMISVIFNDIVRVQFVRMVSDHKPRLIESWCSIVKFTMRYLPGDAYQYAAFASSTVSLVTDMLLKYGSEETNNNQICSLVFVSMCHMFLSEKQTAHREIFANIILQALNEVQPMIAPTFAGSWFFVMMNSVLLTATLQDGNTITGLTYITVWSNIFSVVEFALEMDSQTMPFMNALCQQICKSAMLIVDKNEFIVSKYYFKIVPKIPPCFIFIRDVFLQARDQPFSVTYKMHMAFELLMKDSQSFRNPSCHDIIFNDFPRGIRKALEYLPAVVDFESSAAHFIDCFKLQNGEINHSLLYHGVAAFAAVAVDTMMDGRPGGFFDEAAIKKSPYAHLIISMYNRFEPADREIFLVSILDQLRFPNSHSTFYTLLLCYWVEISEQDFEITLIQLLTRQLSTRSSHRVILYVCAIEVLNRTATRNYTSHLVERQIIEELLHRNTVAVN